MDSHHMKLFSCLYLYMYGEPLLDIFLPNFSEKFGGNAELYKMCLNLRYISRHLNYLPCRLFFLILKVGERQGNIRVNTTLF